MMRTIKTYSKGAPFYNARPLSGVLIRANGLDCLRAEVSASVPVLLLGGLWCFGGRDRRAAPATRWPNWWFCGKWDSAAEWVVSFGLPAVRLRGSGRTPLCYSLHTWERTLAFDSEL